jgi:hypothetical protein
LIQNYCNSKKLNSENKMKNNSLKHRYQFSLYFVLICLLVVKNISIASTCSISFKSDTYPVTVKLLKYTDGFKKELVNKIIISGPYIFKMDIAEIDTYILESDDSAKFLVFFWDGDVEIYIKTNDIDQSAILKSPYSKESEDFERLSEEKIFKKIKQLDTLLANLRARERIIDKDSLQILKNKRASFMSASREEYERFTRQYLKDHPKSFVALYYMQILEIVPGESERKILQNMPQEYKNNHRYLSLISH